MLLDAFLVRLLLVPVLLRLLGRAAWYLPRWLDRILPDVRFGHGERPIGERLRIDDSIGPAGNTPVGSAR